MSSSKRKISEISSCAGKTEQDAQTPLQKLAARITAHADALAASAANISHPGGTQGHVPAAAESTSLLFPDIPVEVQAEKTSLRDALAEALIFAADAKDFVPDLAARNNQFACVRWLCHFRIPEALPLEDGENSASHPAVPYATVAQKTGVPLHQLRSIARMALLMGFLSEPEPDQLSHSPLSAAMVRDPGVLEWARFVTSTSAPMVSAMVEATERWGGDRDVSKTAYAVAWQTELPLFAHVASDKDLQARYAAYMRVMTQSRGMALRHILEGWKEGWSALAEREAVLVDVGGSSGHVSAGIARRFPGIKVLVQDRAEVVERARQEVSPGLDSEGIKLAFQGHDFFSAQPERPLGFEGEGRGDVYFLRQILHDWDDERSLRILQHLAAALEVAGPEGRLIVMDTVLPEPGTVSRSEEALLRVRDLTMQQAHNTHERSRAEWEELFKKADSRLEVQRVVQPFKSLMAIIEIVLKRK